MGYAPPLPPEDPALWNPPGSGTAAGDRDLARRIEEVRRVRARFDLAAAIAQVAAYVLLAIFLFRVLR